MESWPKIGKRLPTKERAFTNRERRYSNKNGDMVAKDLKQRT
jgi:hypothetical protein